MSRRLFWVDALSPFPGRTTSRLSNTVLFWKTSPMEFQVLVEDQPRPVELIFGSEKDVARVSRWRAPAAARQNPAVRDTLEFARLASKRWRHYRRSISTATSIAELRAAIRRNAQVEVSFLLLARAEWFPSSSALGLAQCRRTYCHHFILEHCRRKFSEKFFGKLNQP
jgi:hypothetical protein